MDIEGKVVVITGASSGIGAALARLVHQRGGIPVLAARREDRIEALAVELDGALAVPTDVCDDAQLQALLDATLERHGRIDVLVNNAGQGMSAKVEDMPLDDLRKIIEVNLIYPAVAIRLVAPIMRKQGGGTILNVSSGTSRVPFAIPGYAAYASAKSGLNKLTETARAELAADGITVSVILPFITDTEFHDVQIKVGDAQRPAVPIEPHTAEYAAEKMLELIASGDAELLLAPDSVEPPA